MVAMVIWDDDKLDMTTGCHVTDKQLRYILVLILMT